MGTLLRTIIGNTSRMQIFLVLITVAIVTAQERGGGRGGRRGQRPFEIGGAGLIAGGSDLYQERQDQICRSWYQNEIKTGCKATRNNSPWRTLDVVQLPPNATFPSCNLACVGFEDDRCKFWAMNELTKECLLIGYPKRFTLSSNAIVYVSGVSCAP